MKAFVCASAVLFALAVSIAVGQQSRQAGGGKVESVGARQPRQPSGVGILGERLGFYLTIEGTRAERGKVGTRTLLVDTVGGKKLAKPVAIWVENLDLPAEQRCVLKGYESGRMIGQPPAVAAAAREQGRKEPDGPQAGWQWQPYFVALIVVEPKGLVLRNK
jgi:hypothetical protein